MSGFKEIKGKNSENRFKVFIPIDQTGPNVGSFEIWDHESGGYFFYEEGQLIFEDDELIDYDGILELPGYVISAIAKECKIGI